MTAHHIPCPVPDEDGAGGPRSGPTRRNVLGGSVLGLAAVAAAPAWPVPVPAAASAGLGLSLINISEPPRPRLVSYGVFFCWKKNI
ncbi:hypothetical protein, partial [Streptomyces bambusae]|uniref:hypothetical protein n=1 Tax=Streptomyces bambusae TaxID=1550616 RepID=UPI001CA49796